MPPAPAPSLAHLLLLAQRLEPLLQVPELQVPLLGPQRRLGLLPAQLLHLRGDTAVTPRARPPAAARPFPTARRLTCLRAASSCAQPAWARPSCCCRCAARRAWAAWRSSSARTQRRSSPAAAARPRYVATAASSRPARADDALGDGEPQPR